MVTTIDQVYDILNKPKISFIDGIETIEFYIYYRKNVRVRIHPGVTQVSDLEGEKLRYAYNIAKEYFLNMKRG